MSKTLICVNSSFIPTTLADNVSESFEFSVLSHEELYFSVEQGVLKGVETVVLLGNLTLGDKILQKIKEAGVKRIIDGTIVLDDKKLDSLAYYFSDNSYLKLPLAETTLIYSFIELFKKYGIEELFVNLMLSASHYGDGGIEELTSQTVAIFNQEELLAKLFKERLAFNILPLINKNKNAGYLDAIHREVLSLAKKDGLPNLLLNEQVVLTPTLSSTASVFKIKTKKKITKEGLYKDFASSDLFYSYNDLVSVPVNSNIADGKIHVSSVSIIDDYNFSFYAVADNIWTLFLRNLVRCLESMS